MTCDTPAGIAFLPKNSVSVETCEVARIFRLLDKTMVSAVVGLLISIETLCKIVTIVSKTLQNCNNRV